MNLISGLWLSDNVKYLNSMRCKCRPDVVNFSSAHLQCKPQVRQGRPSKKYKNTVEKDNRGWWVVKLWFLERICLLLAFVHFSPYFEIFFNVRKSFKKNLSFCFEAFFKVRKSILRSSSKRFLENFLSLFHIKVFSVFISMSPRKWEKVAVTPVALSHPAE